MLASCERYLYEIFFPENVNGMERLLLFTTRNTYKSLQAVFLCVFSHRVHFDKCKKVMQFPVTKHKDKIQSYNCDMDETEDFLIC